MPPLTELQQRKVEENLGLVGQVIKERVHGVGQIGIFSYDDLFQIGTIGLCKAVQTDRPGKGAFSTYAYRIIYNEIMTQLDYATLRRQRERATDPAELPCMTLDDGLEQTEALPGPAHATGTCRADGFRRHGQGYPGHPAPGPGIFQSGHWRTIWSSK